jgi:hypothetical protein
VPSSASEILGRLGDLTRLASREECSVISRPDHTKPQLLAVLAGGRSLAARHLSIRRWNPQEPVDSGYGEFWTVVEFRSGETPGSRR